MAKKEFIMSHLSTVVVGFIVAVGIHFLVIDDADLSGLKTSINDIRYGATHSEVRPDISFAQASDGHVTLTANTALENIDGLTLSFTYNPEEILIESVTPSYNKTKILNLSNIPGIHTVVLEWPVAKDISSGETLLDIMLEKQVDHSSGLNIIVESIEFSDKQDNSYTPTTAGIQL